MASRNYRVGHVPPGKSYYSVTFVNVLLLCYHPVGFVTILLLSKLSLSVDNEMSSELIDIRL